jgi:cytochrome c-type biogenesis protein CcmH
VARRRLIKPVLVLLVTLLAAGPTFAISDPAEMLSNPGQEARAEQIGRQLRCLVCQNESIEDSGADLARDLRAIVRQRVAAGDTDRQVVAWMVARYGDFVRLRPPFNAVTALLWLSPVLAVAIGFGLVRLGRRARVVAAAPLTDAERARLADLTRP